MEQNITLSKSNSLNTLSSENSLFIDTWAETTTKRSVYDRLVRVADKKNRLFAFFQFINKPIKEVGGLDILLYKKELESRKVESSTIYQYLTQIGSFYNYIGGINPVAHVLPVAPDPYHSTKTKALTDEQISRLLEYVKSRNKRDYILLRFFILSGLRRREVIQLKVEDLNMNTDGEILLHTEMKGGIYRNKQIVDTELYSLLKDYIGGRGGGSVWLNYRGGPLTSDGFAKNMKIYSKAVKIDGFHIHSTRHTFARITAEDSGSINDVQAALNHSSIRTTKYYVDVIETKKDRWSAAIRKRIDRA